MKKLLSLFTVLIIWILILSGVGTVAFNSNIEKFDSDIIDNKKCIFTHSVLGEFGTATTCVPCKYAHQALKIIYNHSWYPFYYVTLVRNKNDHAFLRTNELQLRCEPTVWFDGGAKKNEGAVDTESALTMYNSSIKSCGNRVVADIDLSVDVEWLGAVNPVPVDGETNVSICAGLSWNNSAMNIDISVDNNEASDYDGHLHVYVTEVDSSYWLDKFHFPYTFAFLDYAWNEDIEISTGGSWEDSMEWDGCDYDNGLEDEYYILFDDVFQDNIMVIATVFNSETNFSDETTGTLAGVNTDPKTYDIYFGETTPPPKIISNQTSLSFNLGILDWNTTYYWKVDVIDNQGNVINGKIWSFTTRGNDPPDTPSNPKPINGETDVDIDTNISWSCNDPDGDDVFYDVYFGKTNPPPKLISNQSETSFDPQDILDFNTTYYWQIIAWDEFEYSSVGPLWSFTTEGNLPPNTPDNPHPPDGVTKVPIYVTLRWTGGDPNSGDIVTYNIYLGTDYPPKNLVSDNQTETCYAPTELELNRTYFWNIVAWDSQGLSTTGPYWFFTTGINNPPGAPKIIGPKAKNTAKLKNPQPVSKPPGTYNYTFKAIDPDDDDVYYYIDWKDGSHEDWIGPYPSDEKVIVSHTWVCKGTYCVEAKAKDIYGQEGPWGTEHITIEISQDNDYYNNCIVIIFGRSNHVQAFSLWWRIGLYIPIIKRGFTISANEEGESLTAIIFKINGGAFYLDNENITIDIYRARGLFYWGGKSLLFNYSIPSPVFAICRARTVYINT